MSIATILVVDDEPDLLDNLRLALEAEGYGVITAGDGREALAILPVQPVDLILADIAMPDINGYQLYERVRDNPAWGALPFIFLTARKLDSDIRYGKELGVDDYLTKPIRAADLLAVVRGKLRRAQQLRQSSAYLHPPAKAGRRFLIAGQLKIDLHRHQIWLNDQEVNLSAREFTLLEYLARQEGKIVSPQELIKVTHGMDTDSLEAGALVRSFIHAIRQKLGNCIENVRGVGYRLSFPED
ncbi:MAG: response regulator transcription factor [Anaerolineae bacterium]|nr:response regulator transcription factor [Anaerolineae bacterium]